MKKNVLIHTHWPLVFVMLLFQQSCNSVNDDWEKATQANTIEVFQKFMTDHPGSKYIGKAQCKICLLQLDKAGPTATIDSLRRIFEKCTDCDEACIVADKVWSIISQQSIEGYIPFIKSYGKCPAADSAKKVLSGIELTILNDSTFLILKGYTYRTDISMENSGMSSFTLVDQTESGIIHTEGIVPVDANFTPITEAIGITWKFKTPGEKFFNVLANKFFYIIPLTQSAEVSFLKEGVSFKNIKIIPKK